MTYTTSEISANMRSAITGQRMNGPALRFHVSRYCTRGIVVFLQGVKENLSNHNPPNTGVEEKSVFTL